VLAYPDILELAPSLLTELDVACHSCKNTKNTNHGIRDDTKVVDSLTPCLELFYDRPHLSTRVHRIAVTQFGCSEHRCQREYTCLPFDKTIVAKKLTGLAKRVESSNDASFMEGLQASDVETKLVLLLGVPDWCLLTLASCSQPLVPFLSYGHVATRKHSIPYAAISYRTLVSGDAPDALRFHDKRRSCNVLRSR
jgi:hypothetical protein